MGCGGTCGNRSWDAETRQRWSEDHAGRTSDLARILAPPQPFANISLIPANVPDRVDAAVAGRPAREYGAWMASRWRGAQRPVAVSAAETEALGSVNSLYLGESPRWGTLMASLPDGQRPVVPSLAMLATLLPESDHSGLAWQLAAADAGVRSVESERPGLFWRGAAAPHRAAWALASWAGGRGSRSRPLVVGPMPVAFRDRVAPDTAQIRVDAGGRVRLARTSPLLSWSHGGQHHALEQTKGVAAMADYHLWWAHRLFSYHCTDSKSPWDLLLAREALNRAMRWVGRLTSELRHLDGHGHVGASREVRYAQ